MFTSDFSYYLPKGSIAQTPIHPRDHSRLLVYERKTGKSRHQHFFDLPKFLQKGDLLVFNDTKVFKARLIGRVMCHPRPVSRYGVNSSGDPEKNGSKLDSLSPMPLGDKLRGDDKRSVEVFLLKSLKTLKNSEWEVLAKPGRKLKIGTKVKFAKNLFCQVKEKKENGTVIVRFNKTAKEVIKQTEKLGHIPVPPYIKKEPSRLSDYQTIYAKHLGSVAAPTAGFHFTPRLFKKLKTMGVQTAFVTLHVGLGTFQPVKTEKIEEHQMHSEYVELTGENAERINQAKREGRRVIAVGTTTVRTLEGIALLSLRGGAERRRGNPIVCRNDKVIASPSGLAMTVKPYSGEIDIFITPGFKFQAVDALITNFHLPKSTLLMLVSAFIGERKSALKIYKKAIEQKYRFYSFGDAVFIF